MNRKRKVPKSKVAATVHQQARPYCQIFFICKGSLGCTRYLPFHLHASLLIKNCIAILLCNDSPSFFFGNLVNQCCCQFILNFRDANQDSTKADSPRSSSASTFSDETELPTRSVSLPPGHPGYRGSHDESFLPRRSHSVSYPSSGLIGNNVERMSPTAQQSIHVKTTNCSPNSSLRGSSSSSLKDSDSVDGSPVPASVISYEEQQMSMVSPEITSFPK